MPADDTPHARARDATAADLPRVLELLAQLQPAVDPPDAIGPPTPEVYGNAFARIEADPNLRIVVVESDGAIVGTCALVLVPNLTHRGRPYAIIENVVVDETRRGERLGEALIAYAVDLARDAGCYKVSLTSNKEREAAHRFYSRAGFRATHDGFRIEF